jgi:C1A family cysteine protease
MEDFMKMIFITLSLCSFVFASNLPDRHINLLPFVQEAPDQGDVASCLYMATTGSIELLLNQKYGIRHPTKGDLFDISERFTMNYKVSSAGSWHLTALGRLNKGWAISENLLPFSAWREDSSINRDMWKKPPGFYDMERIKIDHTFSAQKLFVRGKNRHSRYVVRDGDIEAIKKALVKNNAPVLINYNHNRWWHMINIVGYDDNARGECTHTPQAQCSGMGAFYVRDSLGKEVHLRDYDWFRVNGNAAFVITMK